MPVSCRIADQLEGRSLDEHLDLGQHERLALVEGESDKASPTQACERELQGARLTPCRKCARPAWIRDHVDPSSETSTRRELAPREPSRAVMHDDRR